VKNYAKFIENGFHIVAANKKANTLPYPTYQALHETFKKHKKHFFYEANVGAGLPVIATLKDLLACGDEVIKIEGVLSGTLSYIFNNLEGKKFSEIVQEAKEKGFTEPDPNEDLCGLDVGRKLLILARLIGLPINLEDIKIQSLVGMEPNVPKGTKYIAKIENGQCSAGLQEASQYSLTGTENIVAITTKFYNKMPLVLKGPGAGGEVTALGIMSDLLKLLEIL
jgi:aspartokinase/homoserine dehydrogenase 1